MYTPSQPNTKVNTYKRTLIIVSMMIAVMVLLSACGQKNESATNPPQSGVTETGVAPADGTEQLMIKATNYAFDQKEYHVKKGQPVQIVFESVQGNHGVMIPALNVDLDSQNTTATVTPQEAGQFDIACSIMCGSGHSTMVAKLIVDEA
ncbi:cupredoxin domain-containing protein [Paenibacillus sp. KACC 21273]|uniref:cupredoxin domain-containing protein n=1 Tax=Paenibacillus sp. KACC 21273 TaxID=3025665 RepID=UPI002365FD03|nr:cupredoxin domain-containing protein [Paenibacillus sp. KACC 21273]WDF49707.1 cupredoxin domain-containing protein [Paenibacillus sp. KACC 21273]